ncbi:hypothetical protein PROFUN_07561 [Planoprotostelium fungivorum]|uniref:Uncharacterized protein n=1 Tax=Planoprotostelium fungivorum TaxID=1890364 RepID=A0A2P6NLR8_9EUKA|nr:hypothetical protein PROFUN_07561 [Planoprotostelium fungivorum]
MSQEESSQNSDMRSLQSSSVSAKTPNTNTNIIMGEVKSSFLDTSSLMGSLITSRFGDDTFFECPICQEPYNYAVETPCCGKCYCRDCLFQWLDKSADCPECRQPIKSREECKPNRAIQRMISSIPIPCPNAGSGCQDIINRGNVETHRTHCLYEPVLCKWSKLCGSILRGQLQQHERDLCPYKPSTCPKCEEPIAEARLLNDHYKMRCPMTEVDCPECHAPVVRKDLQSHVEVCPERRETCPYSQYGCTKKEKNNLMHLHMQNDMGEHLKLVEETLHMDRSVLSSQLEELRRFIVTLRPQLTHSPLVGRPVLLPTRLVSDSPHQITVEANYEVFFKGGLLMQLNKASAAKMVRGDVPIPSVNSVYYFEVTVLFPQRGGEVGVGLAETNHSMDGMPGWTPGSFGFHGDDGNLFHTEFGTKGQKYSEPFGKGDVIGLGWDQKREFVFYTKNGELLGVAFGAVTRSKQYYPVIGMHTVNARARVNFGAEPFLYKQLDIQE